MNLANRALSYLNPLRELRDKPATAFRGGRKPTLSVPLQYLCFALGIAVEPIIAAFKTGTQWDLSQLWPRLLGSGLLGLILFPAVYRGTFDPEKPAFVQYCAIFALGAGWQSLVKTGTGAVQ